MVTLRMKMNKQTAKESKRSEDKTKREKKETKKDFVGNDETISDRV